MILKRAIVLSAMLLLISGAAGTAGAQDYQRAVRNYQAVISGSKKITDLTPAEQNEVLAVYRALSRRTPSDASESCRSAREEAETAQQELQDRARRLMRCAENSDLSSDDCDSEARRARNAQQDFSSKVSEVQSECS